MSHSPAIGSPLAMALLPEAPNHASYDFTSLSGCSDSVDLHAFPPPLIPASIPDAPPVASHPSQTTIQKTTGTKRTWNCSVPSKEGVNQVLAKFMRPDSVSASVFSKQDEASVFSKKDEAIAEDCARLEVHQEQICQTPGSRQHILPRSLKSLSVSRYTFPAGSSSISKFKVPISDRSCCNKGSGSAGTDKTTENPRTEEAKPSCAAQCFYSIMYRAKKKNAKHKGPWFDGVLVVVGRKCTLLDTEGKTLYKGDMSGNKNLSVDSIFELSRYQIEVMKLASAEEYQSGSLFTSCSDQSPRFTKEEPNKENAMPSSTKNWHSKGRLKLKRVPMQIVPQKVSEDALILNPDDSSGIGSIIVDQYIATKLRPHQREGVRFMFECVMGLRAPQYTGCLLADEMGLGKTLQVIALIWTLLRQTSIQGDKSSLPFKHVVVVCPSSLVQNWGNEVKKWLGPERLRALIVNAGIQKETRQKFVDFKTGRMYPLLITSYELLRKYQETIASSKPDLLVCDEAHRLKNSSGNKTIAALLALNCRRRILLTGTPVQNDLNEFYAMVDFANPNLLGPLSAFKRLYTEPIGVSRDRDSSDEQKELGKARFLELQKKTKFCILRRTAAVNKNYLPTKTEYLVFCQLRPLQMSLYKSFLRSQLVTKLFLSETSSASALNAISVLRKLCNHPKLVIHDVSKEVLEDALHGHALIDDDTAFPTENLRCADTAEHVESSGKFDCVRALLSVVLDPASEDETERVVIVSNFTQTLNLLQGICEKEGWPWLRLDGSTVVADRQGLVDRFNSGFGGERVFLLSSKAGGMGLNLVAANRLILFDPDWNPATDAQAMARIWREGQKRPVIIYRLLSTGSIEEKIYQRQIVKGEIAATVEEDAECRMKVKGGRYFSRKELRELFTLDTETRCETRDRLCGGGLPDEGSWRDCSQQVEDPALKRAIHTGIVSFVHRCSSSNSTPSL